MVASGGHRRHPRRRGGGGLRRGDGLQGRAASTTWASRACTACSPTRTSCARRAWSSPSPGMEGALPSLVAGLVNVPVVAVPTSVGYGANFGGVSALLTMLNSCAGGIGVVNIDNGFGAAVLAIAHQPPGVGRASSTPKPAQTAATARQRVIGYLDCSTGVSGDKFLGALLDVGAATGAFTAEDLQALLARTRARGPRDRRARIEPRHLGAQRVGGSRRAARVAHVGEHPRRPGRRRPARRGARARGRGVLGAGRGRGRRPRDRRRLRALPRGRRARLAPRRRGNLRGAAGPGHRAADRVASRHRVGHRRHVARRRSRFPRRRPPHCWWGCRRWRDRAGGGEAPGELTTPTGAALVRVLADGFGPCEPLVPQHIGYGAGTRDIGSPNVCRIIVGEPAGPAPSLRTEQVTLLETNVDHISAEASAFAAEQLLAEGALDVWLSPIVMKKGRAGHLISVLAATGDADRLAAAPRRAHRHAGSPPPRPAALRRRARAAA